MTQKIAKAWHRFLQTNFNSFLRSAPNLHKVRRYENVAIKEKFEEVDRKRKESRLALLAHQKKLKKQMLEAQLKVLERQKTVDVDVKTLTSDEYLKADLLTQEALQNFAGADFTKFAESKLQSEEKKQLDQKVAAPAQNEEMARKIAEITSDLKDIQTLRAEISSLDTKIEELEPDQILVQGIQKKIVLNMLQYYEFQHRNLQGALIHPETMKSIETVHYHVENNLPVRRELLFEVVPELFEAEIGQLDRYERERIEAKRPRINMTHKSGVGIFQSVDNREPKEDFFEECKRQEMEFMDFVFAKASEFAEKWSPHVDMKLAQGFSNVYLVLENLENKPTEKLSEEESVMLKDLKDLRKVNDDYAALIRLNKVRIHKKQRELYIPPWVEQNETLKNAWVKKWEELVEHSIDLKDSIFVPDNASTVESQLDKLLKEQRGADIQELIDSSNQQYKARLGGDEPVRSHDLNKKNTDLVSKLNVISNAMNKVQPQIPKKRKMTSGIAHFQSNVSMKDTPEDGKILLEELPKVLFLNNTNPKKYNLGFWADYFNIQPAKLRNVFNYVSYAVPDKQNARDTGKVYKFIEDDGQDSSQPNKPEQKLSS